MIATETELDGAMAAIEQRISEIQRGIRTYQNKPDQFPRLEARQARTTIAAMCGVTEAFARTLIKHLADQGQLVRSGESTATMYTTPQVHDAQIASRVRDRVRVDAVIAALVRRGIWPVDHRPSRYLVTDSKGTVWPVYAMGDPIRIDWQTVESLLGLTPKEVAP